MTDQKRRLEALPKENAETAKQSVLAKKNDYIDPLTSTRGGFGGFFETLLRRFKDLVHLAVIIPIYGVVCWVMGLAVAPSVLLFEALYPATQGLPLAMRAISVGALVVACYFTYGFSMILIVPTVNFVLRMSLKPWRGPYYSLEAIRWYFHNGLTYLVRYTFLELATPTPFSVFFYRAMGMKIGAGTAINTTCISDPSMIELGDKVTVGGSATLIAHYGQGGFLVLAPVKIGDKVTIGLRATIMGGVTIGEGAKILPHSVVMPKTVIPAGETWGGIPARKMDF